MMSFRDAVIEHAVSKELRNIVLPSTYFYPLLPNHAVIDVARKSTDFTSVKKESMAIHHYAASWVSQSGKVFRAIITKLKFILYPMYKLINFFHK
jgi:hypothetical protein